MTKPVISVENLSKAYRLGQIGTGTFSRDLEVWWARVRGKPNPLLKIGQTDHGNRAGENIWALKDISFDVEQGEVLGIIGKNGAGKSTLLKILSRVTAPTSGRVKVKGRIASLLEVGTGFHPELTGRENIYLNGAILGMTKEEIRKKFDEIVSFAEIEKFIDTPVKRYSSGMYVRLAFAVAAHLESEILLVDEVLAVGDAEFQRKCLGKMGDVASNEGRTVLFVSHNMGAILQLCKLCLLISNGIIERLDYPSNVVNKYLESKEVLQTLDLALRTDRKGIGRIKVIAVFSEDRGRNINPVINAGQAIRFIFVFSDVAENLEFAFGIYDSFGILIAGFSTKEKSEYDVFDSKINRQIICEIPELTLNPGYYSINCYLRNNGIVEDRIENVYIFQVFEGNLRGRVIRSGGSAKITLHHQWTTS